MQYEIGNYQNEDYFKQQNYRNTMMMTMMQLVFNYINKKELEEEEAQQETFTYVEK